MKIGATIRKSVSSCNQRVAFGWNIDDNPDQMGQAVLAGHLLECAGQVTGGYFADPGYKDVPDLWKLGALNGKSR